MLVCHCAAVNDRRIREAMARGADDLVTIADDCGAGSFCGGCQPTVEALLAEAGGAASGPPPPSPPPAAAPGTPARVGAPTGRGARREPFRSVVRSVEEDVLATGWVSGQVLGRPADLARRYRCTRATLTRAVWVLEQHGIVAVDPATGAVRVSEPDDTAIAEAAALHLWSAGATADELERARVLLADVGDGSRGAEAAARDRDPGSAVLTRALRHVTGLRADAAVGDPGPPGTATELARRIACETSERALRPGGLVGTERELRTRYGVSADLLHQAATLLEYYAVAHRYISPDGGVVVSACDPWPAAQLLAMYLDRAGLTGQQLFEVRLPLEVAAVERASRTASPDSVALLRQRLDEERQVHRRHRHADFASAGHHDVHVVIAQISGDPVVRLFVDALKLVAVRTADRWGARTISGERDARLLADHEAIVEAVAAGQGDRARQRMHEHLSWLERSVEPTG